MLYYLFLSSAGLYVFLLLWILLAEHHECRVLLFVLHQISSPLKAHKKESQMRPTFAPNLVIKPFIARQTAGYQLITSSIFYQGKFACWEHLLWACDCRWSYFFFFLSLLGVFSFASPMNGKSKKARFWLRFAAVNSGPQWLKFMKNSCLFWIFHSCWRHARRTFFFQGIKQRISDVV